MILENELQTLNFVGRSKEPTKEEIMAAMKEKE